MARLIEDTYLLNRLIEDTYLLNRLIEDTYLLNEVLSLGHHQLYTKKILWLMHQEGGRAGLMYCACVL